MATCVRNSHNITLRFKPRGAHAQPAERHNALLRDTIHKNRIAVVAREDNHPQPFIVAVSVYAENALINIGEHTPYAPVLGQHPHHLAELEEMGQSAITDDKGGVVGASRHSVRLREIAMEAIMQTTAQQRMVRAEGSRTRITGQALQLSVGDLVEIYRQLNQKDLTG